MKPNETLERLSLVLIGVAIGILIGAITQAKSVTSYDILIIELFVLIGTALLRDVAYRKGGE